MPIDSSIPLSVKAPELPSPLEVFSTVTQIQAQREAAELRRLAAQEAREKKAEQQQLDQLYASSVTTDPETGQVSLDYNKMLKDAPGHLKPGLYKQMVAEQQQMNALIKSRFDLDESERKWMGGIGQDILLAKGAPEVVGTVLLRAKQTRSIDATTYERLKALPPEEILPYAQAWVQAATGTQKLEKVTHLNAAGETVEEFVVPRAGVEYRTAPKTESLPSYQDVDAIVRTPDGKTFTGKVGYNPKTNTFAPQGSTTPFPEGTKVERAPTPPNETLEAIRALTLANLQKGKDAMTPAQFSMASRLADDYTLASKDYIVRAQAYQTIQQAAANPSAAGDLVMIFSFMKQNDPGSTVREGEQATAANAAGVPEQVRNLYNRLMTGQRLTPEQRKDFLNQSRLQMTQAQARQRGLLGVYTQRASRANLNPADVVIDYDQVFGLSTADPNAPPPPFSIGPARVQPPTTTDGTRQAPGPNPFRK